MKKFGVVVCLSLMLLSLNGCVTRIGLKDPISFTPSSTTRIPMHLGVILSDETANHSLKRRGTELLVGEAVRQNIGNSLQSVFATVTVSTNVADLPVTVNNIGYVRFAPDTEFYLPATIFSDIKVTVVLDFKVYDKNGKTVIWETTARGTKSGNQPPNLGLLTLGLIHSFYRDLTRDSVQASLTELNDQISTKGKEALTAVSQFSPQ